MSDPGSSQVHVSVPLGSEYRKKKPAVKNNTETEGLDYDPEVNNDETEVVKRALELEKGGPGSGPSGDGKKPQPKPHGGDDLGKDSKNPPMTEDQKKKNADRIKRIREETKKSMFQRAVDWVRKANSEPRRIAIVAVTHGDNLLMGKRRDNGRWTMPGGHVDPGEDFHAGGIRELKEESGLDAEELYPLTEVAKLLGADGQPLHVQAFHHQLDGARPPTSMQDDPDGEVERWRWIDVSGGLPDEVKSNLHVPLSRNIALHALDLGDDETSNQDDDVYKNEDPATSDDSEDENDEFENYNDDDYEDESESDELGMALYAISADKSAGVSKGGPGSGRHPGDNHDANVKVADRKVDAAGRQHDANPTPENHQKLKAALAARANAHQARVDHIKGKLAEAENAHIRVASLQSRLQDIGERKAELERQSASSKERTAQLKARLTKSAYETQVPIAKADKAKQIIYCVVTAPDEWDTQDDTMTADEIEKTAHKYLIDSRVVGSNHTEAIKAHVVESYIAPIDFEWPGSTDYAPQKVKKGSWVIAIWIVDTGEWRKVEDGEYEGVSVGGFGLRDKVA